MVRAYFGAKEITLIERPVTHRGTLIEGVGAEVHHSRSTDSPFAIIHAL